MSHSRASQGKIGSSWGASAAGHLLDEKTERREAVGWSEPAALSLLGTWPWSLESLPSVWGPQAAKVFLFMGR